MAKHKSSGGSTLYGLLAGLVIGLMVAAGVAYYVVKAPMPFYDKASRTPDAPGAPDPRQAPDPNAGMGGRDRGTSSAATEPLAPVAGTMPSTSAPAPTGGDALGSLIATLTPTAPAASGGANVNPRPKAEPLPPPPSQSQTAAATGGPYFLQVGSFRVLEDAESLRARILLLGMPVEIQRAEVNGLQVNRVRVGPFARIDDMNQIRTKLGQEKIPTAVVRQ
ncbi:SPOR domain-containing protein [Alcaligenaceae bacterium LF4-65]|jgi:cell division protein FtsN|uniref:SPOR domain-containing protein n=1 Tax=Zwartia hollandica TaxID=324606 RepID=A0A953NAY2_9BURK|nr:SPOR domain-containing protein [Zwartia hollandica]MBZ1349950.1 SPOR domain-containing protein [Zwartia hollandica]